MLTWDRSLQMSKLFKLFYLFKLLLDFFLRRTHTQIYKALWNVPRFFRASRPRSLVSLSLVLNFNFCAKKFLTEVQRNPNTSRNMFTHVRCGSTPLLSILSIWLHMHLDLCYLKQFLFLGRLRVSGQVRACGHCSWQVVSFPGKRDCRARRKRAATVRRVENPVGKAIQSAPDSLLCCVILDTVYRNKH